MQHINKDIMKFFLIIFCTTFLYEKCFSQDTLKGEFIFVDAIFLSDGHDSGTPFSPVVFFLNKGGNRSIYLLKGQYFLFSFSGKDSRELTRVMLKRDDAITVESINKFLRTEVCEINERLSISLSKFRGNITVNYVGRYVLNYFFGIPKMRNNDRLKLTERKVNIYSISSIQVEVAHSINFK